MQDQKNVQTVLEFCKANGISRSLFYKLCKRGAGPRLMRVGRRTLVTSEAANEWRKSLES